MPDIQKLLAWFDENQRRLPWRETSDPYKIWLSEIILQQTRVEQGRSYYLKFVEHFPTINSLANAGEDHVLKLWQGLGYYSRARNLHATAKIIADNYGGKFPSSYHELIKLKGVGPYTAAAVSSIAFGQPQPVMDGNVIRVVSRWFAIGQPVDKSEGKEKIATALQELLDLNHPGVFNQAMMEFGATWCKPSMPDCENCIFRNQCMAFQSGLVKIIPVKSKKVIIKKRYFIYLVVKLKKGEEYFIILNKRNKNDVWKGLYEFPLAETKRTFSNSYQPRQTVPKLFPFVQKTSSINISDVFFHKLTHQHISAQFIMAEAQFEDYRQSHEFFPIPLSQLDDYPVSRLTEKFMKRYDFFLI
jgi:A/G-specific adenine glycosylase